MAEPSKCRHKTTLEGECSCADYTGNMCSGFGAPTVCHSCGHAQNEHATDSELALLPGEVFGVHD